MEKIVKGNRLKIIGSRVDIYYNREKVEEIHTSHGGFAPEIPFLIKFN